MDTTAKCLPCEGGESSGLRVYTLEEVKQELVSLPLWSTTEKGDKITRSFVAQNFVAAMEFLNGVAKVAEEQGHHPDLHLTQYRNVEIQLWTHSMKGVTLNDLVEAKLLDQIPVSYSKKWLKNNPEKASACRT